MRTKFFFKPIVLIIVTFISFYSCEKEEFHSLEEENIIEKEEGEIITNENKNNSSRAPGVHTVRRYYAGAPYTSYSYRLDGTTIGASFGANQGPRFKLNTIDFRSPLPSGTKQLYILQHKANRDFMLTTSRTERNNIMATGGWNDRSIGYYSSGYPGGVEKVYIQTRASGGLVKLYRFYDNAGQSIHLFTTNYHEGASRGYKLEGVVGYVRL